MVKHTFFLIIIRQVKLIIGTCWLGTPDSTSGSNMTNVICYTDRSSTYKSKTW